MKRIFKIIFAAFIFLMIPYSLVLGQDKKSEQKIKIIVDDGSARKIVIDTVFKDGSGPDSLRTKDGTVIFMKHHVDDTGMRHHSGREHFYVTYSADRKKEGKQFKEVTVISSDSLNEKTEGDIDNSIEYSYTVSDSDNDNDTTVEKTKYIIAKDGMVVTVEASDETKAKELVKEIKAKLGVKSEGTDKEESVKVESKKIIKK